MRAVFTIIRVMEGENSHTKMATHIKENGNWVCLKATENSTGRMGKATMGSTEREGDTVSENIISKTEVYTKVIGRTACRKGKE